MSYTDYKKVSSQLGGTTLTHTSTPNIADVNEWISEAEAEINERTGFIYSQVTFTDNIYDWEGNDDILRLPFEIVSISSLSYNDQYAGETPSWTTKTADEDYFVYGESSEIEFNNRKFKPLSGKKRFKVSGVKGKSEVPTIIQRLCTLMVANRVVETVVQNQAFANSGGDVQVGTIKVGNPSSFSISSVESRNREIERLFDKVVGDFKSYRIIRAYDI